jgi:hypothetical protein
MPRYLPERVWAREKEEKEEGGKGKKKRGKKGNKENHKYKYEKNKTFKKK